MLRLTIVFLAWAVTASAATWFSDKGCATSGDGTTLTCGTHGPFTTINAAQNAAACGDIVAVRGPHASDGPHNSAASDGIYITEIAMGAGTGLVGKTMACSSGTVFQIHGCRTTDGCASNEIPIIRGMTLLNGTCPTCTSGWTAQGGGIFSHVMTDMLEPHAPSTDGGRRRTTGPGAINGVADPYTLWQDPETGGEFIPIGYSLSGDNNHSPLPGYWSYDTTTQTIYVNTFNGRDPAQVVYVPLYGYNVWLENSSWVTIEWFTMEGNRLAGINARLQAVGIVVRHVTNRYNHTFCIRLNGNAGGAGTHELGFNVCENSFRGVSWMPSSGDGGFGYRLFHFDNSSVHDNVIQDLGASGAHRIPSDNGIDPVPPFTRNPYTCSWCTPPFNTVTWTAWPESATGVNMKQSKNSTESNNVIRRLVTDAMTLDVSQSITVQNNNASFARVGFGPFDFTPDCAQLAGGTCNTGTGFCNQDGTIPCAVDGDCRCVISSGGGLGTHCTAGSRACESVLCTCWNSDWVAQNNVIDNCGTSVDTVGGPGGGNVSLAAVPIADGTDREAGSVFGGKFINNAVTNCGGNCIVLRRQAADPTPLSQFTIAYNTINGQRALASDVLPANGLVINGPTSACTIANNLVQNVGGDGILTSSNIGSPTMDNDVVGTNPPVSGNQARWNMSETQAAITGGSVGTLAAMSAATGFETHGVTGDAKIDATGYHIQAGSVAIGAAQDIGVTTDIDPGGVRPFGGGFDSGCDQFGTPGGTTTTATTTTTTSTTTTTLAVGQVRLQGITLQGPSTGH